MQFIFSYIAKRKRNGLDQEEKKTTTTTTKIYFLIFICMREEKNHLRFDIPATFNQA
jgi:hypothetical protein